MRTLTAGLLSLSLIALPQTAAGPGPAFSTPRRLSSRVTTYRAQPGASGVSAALHAMRKLGLPDDQGKAGFSIGFVAGVLADDPHAARTAAIAHDRRRVGAAASESGPHMTLDHVRRCDSWVCSGCCEQELHSQARCTVLEGWHDGKAIRSARYG